MRSQEQARDDALHSIVATIDALQDADASESTIDKAEDIYVSLTNE